MVSMSNSCKTVAVLHACNTAEHMAERAWRLQHPCCLQNARVQPLINRVRNADLSLLVTSYSLSVRHHVQES